jgi:hypothetical protein
VINICTVQPAPTASLNPGPVPTGTATADPEEIDISQHHYSPATQPRLPSPFAFEGDAMPSFPSAGQGQGTDPAQDPMMQMLQQMMGGGMPGAGAPTGSGQPGDLPPGLANMFSAMQGGAQQEPSPNESSAWIWRIVHSLFSLGLAIFIVSQTPFTGSKLARTSPSIAKEDWTLDSQATETFRRFFYMFATFEVLMQSTRYFLEKGRLQGSGILNTIGQVLPEPYAGYVRVVGRYSVIYSTVVSDAMVVIFVLGAACYWKGSVVS